MSDAADRPRAPAGLTASARRLWAQVLDEYELEQHEVGLLREMCRTQSQLDRLDRVVREEGAVITDRFGEPKTHPAAVEARQLRITLARLSAALRLPAGEEGDQQATRRPQRRVGARGVYRLRGVS